MRRETRENSRQRLDSTQEGGQRRTNVRVTNQEEQSS